MKTFETKTYKIPVLKGLSQKSIDEHLKLYAGYVKNSNLVLEKIEELKKEPEKNAYALSEISRRFGFEYNGMRNHEIYFASLEGGANAIKEKSPLYQAITENWGSFEAWLSEFKAIAMTRGIGWAMLYYDYKNSRLLNAWVDEHHIGQLNGCELILGLDMWEHSFVLDYLPSGKKNYIEDFFVNLNWRVVEENFLVKNNIANNI
ncbi:MAG: Fe-Mn family superoxide dismutase [Candidatus Paceibacterota bacterium]|jgi:Fe-Mn family superoxide dismutase